MYTREIGMCLCGENHCHVYTSTKTNEHMLNLSHPAVHVHIDEALSSRYDLAAVRIPSEH